MPIQIPGGPVSEPLILQGQAVAHFEFPLRSRHDIKAEASPVGSALDTLAPLFGSMNSTLVSAPAQFNAERSWIRPLDGSPGSKRGGLLVMCADALKSDGHP